MSQSQKKFNPDGSMHNWEYCLEVAGTLLCRLIARLGVHVCMGETEAFEKYIKIAHNPSFVCL